MSNQRIATLIAERIPHGLQHPGDPTADQPPFAIPLPGLRATGIPPELAARFAADAGLPSTDTPRLIGEALVHMIEADGDSTIIANAELAALRTQAADAPEGIRIITVYDRADQSTPLFELTIGKTDRAVIDRQALVRSLAGAA